MIESFWSRMQLERLDRRQLQTGLDLSNALFEYLEIFHTRKCRHSALGMAILIEYEGQNASATAA